MKLPLLSENFTVSEAYMPHGGGDEMLLKSMVWVSSRSICCGGGKAGGRERERERQSFSRWPLFKSNRDIFISAAWARGITACCVAVATARTRRMYTDGEVLSQTRLFARHLFSLLLDAGTIRHSDRTLLRLWPAETNTHPNNKHLNNTHSNSRRITQRAMPNTSIPLSLFSGCKLSPIFRKHWTQAALFPEEWL